MSTPGQTAPVILVTGAAGGIGSAVCTELEDAGYHVLGLDRKSEGACHLDVTGTHAVTELNEILKAYLDRGTQIHGLVNVAGMLSASRLLDLSADDWDRMHGLNARAIFLVSQAVARAMISQRPRDSENTRGIVTLSSNAGNTPRHGMGGYCASKAAATMITKSLALELAEYGIRCNVVSPGSTDTAMLRSMDPDGSSISHAVSGDAKRFRNGIPLGRVAAAQDIAGVVAFLLSSAARHITGQELTVDGGATL